MSGLDKNMLLVIECLAKNRIQDAKKAAIACCANDTTKKNQRQINYCKNLLNIGSLELTTLPANLQGLIHIQDVSDFPENRYYVGTVQRQLYDKIYAGTQVAYRLADYAISYRNGSLIYGLPGTGKTEFAKYVAYKLQIPYVFKGSYRKANRSRLDSFMGIGDEKALKILQKVHTTFGVPTVTDIHAAEEATMAAEYVDILQIPAFLCRQTDLLVAAAKTGKTINIKKGQFLSPLAMRFAADKVVEAGNRNVMLTERGTTFGYQDLVIDYRGIPEMQTFGFPVILDVTHSLQQPNQTSGVTGGMPQLIETVAKAGVAVGVDGLFIETHENPAVAKSDGANMLKLDLLEDLLTKLVRIREAVR